MPKFPMGALLPSWQYGRTAEANSIIGFGLGELPKFSDERERLAYQPTEQDLGRVFKQGYEDLWMVIDTQSDTRPDLRWVPVQIVPVEHE